jgi:DNA-3-methyladenine glycosylase II
MPGIGPWTAEVYLMFCGGHADVFPAGDVALQAAVGHAFAMESRPSSKQLAALAEIWRPWRSVAARLFWAYYAVRMRRNVTPIV